METVPDVRRGPGARVGRGPNALPGAAGPCGGGEPGRGGLRGGRVGWPPRDALHLQCWGEADGDGDGPATVLLRHPTAPFLGEVGSDDEHGLRALAYDYLVSVAGAARLDLPGPWLRALDPDAAPHPEFGWLPLVGLADGEGEEGPRPIGSPRLAAGRGARARDESVVLLASERIGDFVLGSEFGVRVVLHARRLGGGRSEVRITGLSAVLPTAEYRLSGDGDAFRSAEGRFDLFLAALRPFASRVGQALGLRPDSVFFRGFRLGRGGGPSRRVELRGRGLSAVPAGRSDPYEFLVTAEVASDLSVSDIVSCTKAPLAACMEGTARVFRCDPASQGEPREYRKRRPTRAEAVLDRYREPERVPTPLEIAGRVTVVQTPFVPGDDPRGGPKTVALSSGPPPVRSNDFTAISALSNLKQLFDRLERYGISPEDYFRRARLPIQAFYRSGIRPGPGKDGQTVNARVLPEGWPFDTTVPPASGDRPVLGVHLALGEHSTRARKPWDGTSRSPAEPLGIAADPRWVWHEIGHILLMATLGELEFRFAHSMGDALAAIVGDPCSRLADDPRWRGYTFPWVFTPRRHDRCVLHGWGWSGSLGRALRERPDGERLRLKGYWTEQILSTSLFRLYRCLRGDTVAAGTRNVDRPARQRASDYTVFLVVRALQMLGDARCVPARRAEQFAAALCDADEGTGTWTAHADADPDAAPRVGGCVHKVIRWAFEAQGMYPERPGDLRDAPGLPPSVDIYIQDRRPETETLGGVTVTHGPGAYVPVSLDWGCMGDRSPGGELPGWFAHDGAIRRTNGGVDVAVANRGAGVARGVGVDVWWRRWPPGQTPPPWEAAAWTRAGNPASQDVAGGGCKTFGPFDLPTAPGRYLVLAQASCAADRANTDPATGSACARGPVPLPELVSGDNNLGLAVMWVPPNPAP